VDAMYQELIREAEEELKRLLVEHAQWIEKLKDINEQDSVMEMLEQEISSMILMSHLENAKHIYRFKEQLKREEEQREQLINEQLVEKQRFKEQLIDSIRKLSCLTATS